MYHEVIPSVQLANSPEGYTIPQEGFGVAAMEPELLERSILSALESGYRFFDNAPQYGNEEAVGAILKKADSHVMSALSVQSLRATVMPIRLLSPPARTA